MGDKTTYIPCESLQVETSMTSQLAMLSSLSVSSLCLDSVRSYYSYFQKLHPNHPWLRYPIEDFLMRLNAIWHSTNTAKMHPTFAGLLMFGYAYVFEQYFPGFLLDFRQYEKDGSIAKRIVSNDGTWSGCLFDFWQRVVLELEKAIKQVPNQSQSHKESLLQAAKEGLVNALVHADYNLKCRVLVALHPDFIEFSNPSDASISTTLSFEDTPANPRNPRLMKMFSLINACEDAGTGLALIEQECAHAGVWEPVLINEEEPVRTTLKLFLTPSGKVKPSPAVQAAPVSTEQKTPAKPEQKASIPIEQKNPSPTVQIVTSPAQQPVHKETLKDVAPVSAQGVSSTALEAAMARTSDSEERAALSLFRNSKRIRRSEVEALLGIGSTKAKAIMSSLVTQGILQTEGGGRSTYYKLL